MSRNDSLLHTGLTSTSFASPKESQLKEKQEIAKQKRLDDRHKMTPAADVVLPIIDRHKKQAMFVLNVAETDKLTDKEAGELLRSQRKLYRSLIQIENELKIALRDIT